MGGGLILASITFITWREAMLRHKKFKPTTPVTKS